MITHRPEHLKTFDYIGLHQYFLTFCTHERHKIFVDPEQVAVVRTQIQRAASDLRFAVLAYCYMPDHVHLLIEGLADDSARYILENPVRAGLVEDVRAYPFSGSDTFTVAQILEAIQLQDGWLDRRSG